MAVGLAGCLQGGEVLLGGAVRNLRRRRRRAEAPTPRSTPCGRQGRAHEPSARREGAQPRSTKISANVWRSTWTLSLPMVIDRSRRWTVAAPRSARPSSTRHGAASRKRLRDDPGQESSAPVWLVQRRNARPRRSSRRGSDPLCSRDRSACEPYLFGTHAVAVTSSSGRTRPRVGCLASGNGPGE